MMHIFAHDFRPYPHRFPCFEAGQMQVLVATDVAARGLHVKHLSLERHQCWRIIRGKILEGTRRTDFLGG